MRKKGRDTSKMMMRLTETQENMTRKLSLTRIYGVGKKQRAPVIGWEYAPPQKGLRYAVYLGKGKVLRTSPVEEITETPYALMIKTARSLYEVKYL